MATANGRQLIRLGDELRSVSEIRRGNQNRLTTYAIIIP